MRQSLQRIGLATIIGCLSLAADGTAADVPAGSTWRYVVPDLGQPMEHPPLVSISLGDKRPEIV